MVEPDPLRRLFDVEYRPMVRLAGTLLGGDRAAAEEAVQDAFLRVSPALSRVPEEKWGAYLRTAVVNASRMQVRRAKASKRQLRAVPDVVVDPEALAVGSASSREIMVHVEQLPERFHMDFQCLPGEAQQVRANVFFSDDEGRRKSTVDALNHAAGFIGRELGARMRIRAIPSLKFSLDNSIEYSVHIGKILNSLHTDTDDGEA